MMIRFTSRKSRAALVAPLLLAPAVATAHPAFPGHTHGFAAGLTHPLTGLDHLLAMIAVGLWAAQCGGRALWMVPAAFVSLMAFGGWLGLAGFGPVPFLSQAIVATVLILGILIATAARLPLPATVLVVGWFALFHGYAHGAEMPASTAGGYYGLGFVATTGMLHLCGLGLGLAAQKTGSFRLMRLTGCAIALCGLGWMLAA